MSFRRLLMLLAASFCLAAPPAAAQERTRGFISINGGYQPSTTEFDDTFTFTLHQETGTTRVSYPVDAGPAFDVGGGIRLWRGLGVGVAVSRFTNDGLVRATSEVPHPFEFERHRTVSGEGNDLRREETGIHVQALYSVPVGRRLLVTLMAGPSVLQISQAVVLDVNFTETFPYDTAEFAGVDSSRRTGSRTGFNAGIDLGWMLTRNIGAGALVRVTRATVRLDAGEGRVVPIDAGGLHVGAGVRIGF